MREMKEMKLLVEEKGKTGMMTKKEQKESEDGRKNERSLAFTSEKFMVPTCSSRSTSAPLHQ